MIPLCHQPQQANTQPNIHDSHECALVGALSSQLQLASIPNAFPKTAAASTATAAAAATATATATTTASNSNMNNMNHLGQLQIQLDQIQYFNQQQKLQRSNKRQKGALHITAQSSPRCDRPSNYQQQQQQHYKMKQVRFLPVQPYDVHPHPLSHTSNDVDETDDHYFLSWYNQDELLVFKNDRRCFVKALKRVHYNVDKLLELQDQYIRTHPTSNFVLQKKSHCPRGYEAYFTVAINRDYKHKRLAVFAAVLTEQKRQRSLMEIPDVDLLASKAQRASQWSRDLAFQLAAQDAKDALAYQQEQEEEWTACNSTSTSSSTSTSTSTSTSIMTDEPQTVSSTASSASISTVSSESPSPVVDNRIQMLAPIDTITITNSRHLSHKRRHSLTNTK